MSKSFATLIAELQRLNILQILKDDADYTANTDILAAALTYLGNAMSRDVLEGHILWLAQQHLVKVEQLESLKLVKLTSQGLDVAKGLIRIEGIRRPGPEG